MTTTHRFQIDMTPDELETAERLLQLCGLRTKRELVSNMLTLFKWAAIQVRYGRSIGSFDEEGTKWILELPALSTLAGSAPLMSEEELQKRMTEKFYSRDEVISQLRKEYDHEPKALEGHSE